MKQKPATLAIASLRRSGRASFRRFATFFIISIVLLCTAFVVKRSIFTYQQEQANQELLINAQEALRTEGKFQPNEQQAIFLNEPVSPLAQALPEPDQTQSSRVLGENAGERWIDIDLTTQTLRAMEGDNLIYEFLISSGKWALTPTGEFNIWIKLKYARMTGGHKEIHTFYDLPNVPFVMYFYKGFGIHGAYWHNNFGHPMSHGCINMAIPDAKKLFYWADPQLPEGKSMIKSSDEQPGTRVVIHGETPKT